MQVTLENLMTPAEYVDTVDKALDALAKPADPVEAAKLSELAVTTKSLLALLKDAGITKNVLAWPTAVAKADPLPDQAWPADLNSPEFLDRRRPEAYIETRTGGRAEVAKAAVMVSDGGCVHITSDAGLKAKEIAARHLTALVEELEVIGVHATGKIGDGFADVFFGR